MNRILVAVGAVSFVVIVGLGAATVLGDSGEPQPAPSASRANPTVAPDASRQLDRDELRQQIKDQARQTKAAQDELSRVVREEAERAIAERS